MTAYAILDLDIYDIEHYLAYQKEARPLLESVGARYLVRGGEFKVFEGARRQQCLILLEFPSLAVMEDYFDSEAYKAIEPQRKACSSARIIGVEGL